MSWSADDGIVVCDMRKGCIAPVTHIDTSGFAYCTPHGELRRQSEPCRKLRAWELRRLQKGKSLTRY